MPTTALDPSSRASELNQRIVYFNCPACGHLLTVSPNLAGVTGPCPQCATSITSPRLENLHTNPRSELPTVPAPSRRPNPDDKPDYGEYLAAPPGPASRDAAPGATAVPGVPGAPAAPAPAGEPTLAEHLQLPRNADGTVVRPKKTSRKSGGSRARKPSSPKKPGARVPPALQPDSRFVHFGRRALLAIFILGIVGYFGWDLAGKMSKDIKRPGWVLKRLMTK